MRKFYYILFNFFLILLCFPALTGFAQYFDSGQDPASKHWYQTKSKNFKVVFPKEFEKEGVRFAKLLETSLPKVSASLNHKLRSRLPVLIHNSSAISNGMVSWAPRRMEIYPVPPQSNYPQDWLEQLAIHELRHAVQLDKLNTASAHWLYFLFGEQFTSLLTGLYVPSWYLEGDAVVTETALSNAGRGRVPNFEMELRAQFLEDKIYSYDKAVFGSYKNYVPDRYTLGYYLVGTARELYGKDIWKNALEAVARNPFIPNPFNRGIKRTSGLTEGKLYYRCMQHMDSAWKQQDKVLQKTPFHKIKIKEKSQYADYHFPAYMEDGSFFALRTSIDDIPRFVKIDSTGEITTLFTPGEVNEDALMYSNGKIYWAENIPDLRWENRSWSVIKIYDIHTKELRQLKKRTRWYAPALSADCKKIAVVEVSENNSISLLVVDEQNGQIIHRITTPKNYLFMTPAWEEDRIITVIQGPKGKAIADVNVLSGKMKILTDFTTVEISGPVYDHGRILFLGGYNGIDNVYSLDTLTDEILQITSSRLGAHDAGLSDDHSKVLYVDYTSHGHQLAEAKVSDGLFLPLKKIANTSPRLDSILSHQENGPILFNSGDTSYAVKPYRKVLHLFDIHSWAPANIDVGNTGLSPGVSIMSQNLLSTTFVTLGYQYNKAEQTGKYSADVSYAGLFPVFNLNYSKGERAFHFDYNHSGEKRYTYGEDELHGSISIPLNLSRGKFYRGIYPSAGATMIEHYKTDQSPDWLLFYDMKSLDLGLTAYNLLKSSGKDIFPRWGQILRLQHRQNFPGVDDQAKINGIMTEFYFPGFSRHHSWKLTAGYQEKQSSKFYGFGDFIVYPRGYNKTPSPNFGVTTLDYVFPIFYPEWSIPRFLYIKRLAGALFNDYAWNSSANPRVSYSVGTEITAECHLLRFYAPINLGVRYLYDDVSKGFNFEFLFSFNLTSF